MIRRLFERWLGYDRLLLAYEARGAELDELRECNGAQANALTRLGTQYANLLASNRGTISRMQR